MSNPQQAPAEDRLEGTQRINTVRTTGRLVVVRRIVEVAEQCAQVIGGGFCVEVLLQRQVVQPRYSLQPAAG